MKRYLTLVASVGIATAAVAQTYRGADGVLNLPQGQSARKGLLTAEQFRAQLETFRREAPTLQPHEAAVRWLHLAQALATVQSAGPFPNERPSFVRLFELLPPPAAWADLQRLAHQRSPGSSSYGSSIRLLTDILVGDAAAAVADDRQAGTGMFMGNLGEIAKRFGNRQLTLAALSQARREGGGGSTVDVPDVVTLLGPEKARTELTKLLLTSKNMVQVPMGTRTERLAREIATKYAAKLVVPQWSLAASFEGSELYRLLAHRFPYKTSPEGDPSAQARGEAETYFVGSILIQGDLKHAELAAPQPPGVLSQYGDWNPLFARIEASGQSRLLQQFLGFWLASNPTSPVWDQYLTLSAQLGVPNAPIELVRRAMAKPNLQAETRDQLQSHLYQALLADGKLEQALPIISEAAKREGEAALELIRLGTLLGKPALIDRGVVASKSQPQGGFYNTDEIDIFLRAGRGPEVESSLQDQIRQQLAQRQNFYENYGGYSPNESQLGGLVYLYWAVDRPQDVIALLDKSPDWGVDDLGRAQQFGLFRGAPLTYVAAWSLVRTGHPERAMAPLENALRTVPNFDDSYELLIQLKGADALPELDELYARDRFEERPLIWKAKLLQKLGRLDEAERTARLAISVDPSDGDQHYGHRLLAYSVLADIDQTRGDAERANQLREAVHAIRIGEEGDRLREAYLIPAAIDKYKEALTHFQNAYCLQSRVAVQLAQLGRHAEAAEHYRRAYELMPSSFGRVETHCFGCERVFEGHQAEGIAQDVFAQLEAKQPKNPQVHYLMGYLREQEDRNAEAKAEYEQATALDPDYLNAWVHLVQLADKTPMSAEELDRVQLRLAELDPLNLYGHEEPIRHLDQVWRVASTTLARAPVRTKEVYILAASAAALEGAWRSAMGLPGRFDEDLGYGYDESMRPDIRSPQQVLLRDNFIRQLVNQLSAGGIAADGEVFFRSG